MPQTIDLQKTIDKTNGRITKTFICKTLGVTMQSVINWSKGGVIPKARNQRLIGIFLENGVEPIYK